ncbi:hypothetical protein [Maribacter sp. HTCC2170]|uniref:hypothetical protein n=1 Tax=Maribacter sp. (strain HTCC2170 / KCCM 42371) TaxID=313603 RepID=UPI00006B3B05|nr:hypothetical protein [Maribacter sp. HTCC2170]EAQ99748.1 hypothetical protein FB2170_07329 [Maribacter sp. HTCC2170]
MKNLSVVVLLLSFSLANAQAYPRFNNDNELKFNIGLFLASSTVEGSYEYFFNEDTSIGGTLYFDSDATDYNGNFGIGPNLRAYFGYVPRSGFFAEAFGLYYTGEDRVPDNNLGLRNNDYSTTALGLGIGNKWVTQSERFSLEVNAGLGRNINPEVFQETFMFRAGFSLGFRF